MREYLRPGEALKRISARRFSSVSSEKKKKKNALFEKRFVSSVIEETPNPEIF